MAMDDSENEERSRQRLSPGDAAFERLRRREALRGKESATPERPRETTANPSMGSTSMPTAVTSSGDKAEAGGDSTPRILAVAAAFGLDVPAELLGADATDADRKDAPADGALGSPAIAAAMALGVGLREAPAAVSASPETAPMAAPVPPSGSPAGADPEALRAAESDDDVTAAIVAVETSSLPALPTAAAVEPEVAAAEAASNLAPRPDAAGIAAAVEDQPEAEEAVTAAVDPTAARLEAALLDQLRSLEETLQPAPVRMPRAEPLRMPAASRPRMAEPAEPAGPPGRSPFAPDPVRQRTYVDLRDASPLRAAPGTEDDAPWRKYLARSSDPVRQAPRPVRRVLSPPRPALPGPVAIEAQGAIAGERGRGFRAMSAAAVLGLGVGLGLLVLFRPVGDGPAPVTAAAETPAPALAQVVDRPETAAPGPGDDALATLLADRPSAVLVHPGPAVIAEPGTPPEALVVAEAQPLATARPIPAAQPRPPLISPPPGQPIPVTRGAMYGPRTAARLRADGAGRRPGGPVPDPRSGGGGGRGGGSRRAPAAWPALPRSRATAAARRSIPSSTSAAQPDNAAAVVAVLAQGLSVRVIGCDYWCEIEAGGKRGYVFKKFVSR
jgi:hypothetical protein